MSVLTNKKIHINHVQVHLEVCIKSSEEATHEGAAPEVRKN